MNVNPTSRAVQAPIPKAPAPPAEDPGEVFVTGDGFVQNFGPVVSATGTLRLYESGAAQLLAKDIVLKDGIKLHGDAVNNVVVVERGDGAKIQFQDSELKLPYQEKDSNHAVFELRSHRETHPQGLMEDVFADGDWKMTHFEYVDGERKESALDWKSLSLDERWTQLQNIADASNSKRA